MPKSCPLQGQCNGCQFLGVKYEDQLIQKQDKVKALFPMALPIIASPEIYHYRNRMDYAFGPDFTIGLKDGWNKIFNVEKCLLANEKDAAILNRLRYFVSNKNY